MEDGIKHIFLKLKDYLKKKLNDKIKKKPNILVIGDLMIDHYLWGKL